MSRSALSSDKGHSCTDTETKGKPFNLTFNPVGWIQMLQE